MFSQHYFSYPNRRSELYINDSVIIIKWRLSSPYDTCHYTSKNDTLFITKKNNIVVRKGKYINYFFTNNECGTLFRKNSLCFKCRSFIIRITATNRTYYRKMEWYSRKKQKQIFGKCCDAPLPDYYKRSLL